MRNDIDNILNKICLKLENTRARCQGTIPYLSRNGHYDNKADKSVQWSLDNGLSWWTNGFWGGLMNQGADLTGEDKFDAECQNEEEMMDSCFSSKWFYGLHHDTGFMWLPMSLYRYMRTGSKESKRRALTAAALLAARFNPAGFIRAWNEEGEDVRAGWSIIDSMMNISLLYWAGKETKDPRFIQIANIHAETVRKNFIRQDGSVCHIVVFNPETGMKEAEKGGQGYKEGSRWTRGQSWGIYGFANAYNHTDKKEFLEASTRIADSFIASIPSSYLIPVDFDQPEKPAYEDSTAAAIAASALITLSEASNKEKYKDIAERILDSLIDDRADFSPETDGILQKCTGSYHGEKDREVNFAYADFYFIEALMKLKGKYREIW